MATTTIGIATVLVICIVVAGCASPSYNTGLSSPNVTPNATHTDDFPVHISMDGFYYINGTGTVVKNLSEIVANNYTDIPNFIKMENYFDCKYTPEYNYSKVADIALHDPRIQQILRDNGIVQGMFVRGPPTYTSETTKHPCDYVYATLQFRYQSRSYEALIVNETTRKVILDDKLIQNLTEKFG